MKRLPTVVLMGLSVVLLSGLSTSGTFAQQQTELAQELTALLEAQALAWNRGDIDGFMSAYWKSNELTFSSGGETHRGWKTTRDRYRTNYPDQEAMGILKFSQMEVQQLGDEAALMLGRWHLQKDEPASGNFSLVWRKFDHGWRIIHDHSSLQPPEPEVD